MLRKFLTNNMDNAMYIGRNVFINAMWTGAINNIGQLQNFGFELNHEFNHADFPGLLQEIQILQQPQLGNMQTDDEESNLDVNIDINIKNRLGQWFDDMVLSVDLETLSQGVENLSQSVSDISEEQLLEGLNFESNPNNVQTYNTLRRYSSEGLFPSNKNTGNAILKSGGISRQKPESQKTGITGQKVSRNFSSNGGGNDEGEFGISTSQDYRVFLEKSDVYIDNSLFIKEIFEDKNQAILITMPRRLGKSLNLDMLKRFLSIDHKEKIANKEIFTSDKAKKLLDGTTTSLDIAGETLTINNETSVFAEPNNIDASEVQGTYPVIHVDFKECDGNSLDAIKGKLKKTITKVFKEYKYLENSSKLQPDEKALFKKYSNLMKSADLTDDELSDSLVFLSKLLHSHHGKKVWVLIDEYDAVINSAFDAFGKLEFDKSSKSFSAEGDFEKLKKIFGSILKVVKGHEQYVEKSVVTGILKSAKDDMLSPLNNLKEHNLTDEKYSKYYGFNKDNIDYLVESFEKRGVEIDRLELSKMTNGYKYGDNKDVYNTWSTVNFLNDKAGGKSEPEDTWASSGGLNLVEDLIRNNPTINTQLQLLKNGHEITCKKESSISYRDLLSGDINTVWNILLWTGYLTPTDSQNSDGKISLKIPNNPVMKTFSKIESWINFDSMPTEHLFLLIENNELDKFKEELDDILSKSSTHDASVEKDYHNILFGILSTLSNDKYALASNVEAGSGRLDLAIYNKILKEGYILELKSGKHCSDDRLDELGNNALDQIDAKNYETYFKGHNYPKDIQDIKKIALVFKGKKVLVFPSNDSVAQSEEIIENDQLKELTDSVFKTQTEENQDDIYSSGEGSSHDADDIPG